MISNKIKHVFSIIRYPARGVYDVYEKILHRPVPARLAKALEPTYRAKLPSVVRVPSYDAGGGACHPSITTFQGKTYLACTPYPFSKEAYENPSVFVKDVPDGEWRPVEGMDPAVIPERLGFEHYSDPVLFCQGDKLVLMYRKCERRETGKRDLLYACHTSDGTNWTEPGPVIEAEGNHLISPAVARNGEKLFCVEYYSGDGAVTDLDTALVSYEMDPSIQLGQKEKCTVLGLGPDEIIWHIDVARRQDGRVWGLFALRPKEEDLKKWKLALFVLDEKENVWQKERDIPALPEEKKLINHIYKSAFIEGEERILCSSQCKNGNYCLYERAI